MDEKLDKKQILELNPQIDRNLTSQVEKLEAQLLKIGVKIKPSYRLQHPLGEVVHKSKC